MALIVTLSVFNGFSDLVATLFTAFDPQLEVTPVEGKTAPADDPVLTEIRQLPQVEVATECVEDMALVTYHDRQAMVTVKGVDDNFDRLTHIRDSDRARRLLRPSWYTQRTHAGPLSFRLCAQRFGRFTRSLAGFL